MSSLRSPNEDYTSVREIKIARRVYIGSYEPARRAANIYVVLSNIEFTYDEYLQTSTLS